MKPLTQEERAELVELLERLAHYPNYTGGCYPQCKFSAKCAEAEKDDPFTFLCETDGAVAREFAQRLRGEG
jgi:hypothetical protein